MEEVGSSQKVCPTGKVGEKSLRGGSCLSELRWDGQLGSQARGRPGLPGQLTPTLRVRPRGGAVAPTP